MTLDSRQMIYTSATMSTDKPFNRPSAPGSLSELQKLNERSRTIFRQIVETYLATGEPVGSRNLSRQLPMTLSPASIRNVMSDLEQLGLIYAPHTSAGRLPTAARACGCSSTACSRSATSPTRSAARSRRRSRIKREKSVEQVLQRGRRDDLRPVALRRRGAGREAGARGSSTSSSCRWSPARRWSCWSARTRTSRTASSTCRRACRRRA